MTSANPPSRKRYSKRGFALVVTLVLMVLLAILSLGLLSLASLELRTTGHQQQQALARQNAIFAMNLAISELQKNLGPDQRTSAVAGLVDPSAESSNPNWVGAWNTEGGFRGWLVSGNGNAAQPPDPASDISGAEIAFSPATRATEDSTSSTGWTFGNSPAALLVGEESTGADGLAANRFVFAPVVDLKSQTGGGISGRYAWWVGDEGSKANLAMDVLPKPSSNSMDRISFRKGTPNRGFPTLGGDWEDWLPDGSGSILASASGKIVSRRQIPLASAALENQGKAGFHDFTPFSAGVLSDSKNGGLRKDLSIAFEIPENSFKNSEFTRVLAGGEAEPELAYATNHGGRTGPGVFSGRSTKTAVNFRDPSWSPGNFFRGPTFDLLRDHYQLYRRLNDPFSPSASIAGQTFRPNTKDTTHWKTRGRAPLGDYFQYGETKYFRSGPNYEVTDTYKRDGQGGDLPRLRPMATEMVPELIRYTYTLSIQSHKDPNPPANPGDPDNYKIRLIITPFMVLHNPYNVVLNSPAMWFRIQRAEMAASIQYRDANGKLVDSKDQEFRYLTQSYFGNDTNLETNELAHDAIDYFVSDGGTPSGTIAMQPGETKLFTARGSSAVSAETFFANGQNRSVYMQSGLGDLFSTGIYFDILQRSGWHGHAPFSIPAGTPFTVRVTNKIQGQSSKAGKPGFAWSANEWHTILSKVVPPGLIEPVPLGANRGWEQIKMMNFFPDFYWTGQMNTIAPTQIKPEDIAAEPDGARRYVGKIDMYLKPANDGSGRDNNFSLATHNPRAMVQSPTMTGGQGPASQRGPATWTGSVEALNPATASTPGFNHRFWGTGTSLADGGQRNITLFDVPRAPITSMAAFQNANVSRLGNTPAYTIGNSYASPYVPANGLYWRRSDFWIIDHSYVYNDDLFDSYFFSGVNAGHGSSRWNNPLPGSSVSLTSDPTNSSPLQNAIDNWRSGTTPLLNPRMKFSMPDGLGANEADEELNLNAYSDAQTSLVRKSDLRPHNSIAAYTLNEGAFNINSTSVPAWRALIAGFRGAAVEHLTPGGSMSVSTGNDESPFPRGSLPGAGSSTGSDTNLWNGFRSLSDDQIEDLAEEIVTEIKNRSRNRPSGQSSRPFTTLGEFVNRRIASASDRFSLKGPLQAAIDRTGLNRPSTLTGQTPIPADTNHLSSRGGSTESNAIPYENPAALASSTLAGTPQWFSQADLLEAIGSQLSARSDSFVIRAYGESVNPKTGIVEGRAWLEATVQRGSGFVDQRNHPSLPLTSNELSDENRMFGRRFRVVSFRWLSPKEI